MINLLEKTQITLCLKKVLKYNQLKKDLYLFKSLLECFHLIKKNTEPNTVQLSIRYSENKYERIQVKFRKFINNIHWGYFQMRKTF